MKIYLDTCCYNRPFDDQEQARVHMEAEAVIAILEGAKRGDWTLIAGEILYLELEQMPDPQRKNRVLRLTPDPESSIFLNDAIIDQATAWVSAGVKDTDALHVASAELGGADVFLTTDDRLLKRIRETARVVCDNPLNWIGSKET